jgi:CxxC motif-containing protein (DUF1111 family)
MRSLKLSVALLFAAALASLLAFSRNASTQGSGPSSYPNTPLTAAQSAALSGPTNQADKVSDTGITVTGGGTGANASGNTSGPGDAGMPPADDFGPDCGPGIDCEGGNPFDTTKFTFDPDENTRPEGADGCKEVCPWPLMCPEPICTEDRMRHAAEAPAAFDRQTNDPNFLPQGDPIPKFPPDPGPTPGTFAADEFIFGIVDENDDGLGPVYNAQSCRECHQNPVPGGISQVVEMRAGHNDASDNFIDAPGGSLINDRAIDPRAQERVPPLYTAGIQGGGPPIAAEEPVRTFRTSLNLLGDGFVEAIPNGTLIAISNAQAGASNGVVQGQTIGVPVLEANFQTNRDCANPSLDCVRRIGRFGWKDQVPSLLSFSGDAYLNEIGITNFLILNENTSLGRFVGFGSGIDMVSDSSNCDPPNDNIVCGEDVERDVDAFTAFMRATKAPPQDKGMQHDSRFAADIQAGRQLFLQMPQTPGAPSYSCSICHVPAILTAEVDTPVNGGQFAVPNALGFKVIRPFGDFLLHDVGTGDGIVQNGGQTTRTKVRTPPLWGVRTRTRLMHDGETLTLREAILRHQGEAAAVTAAFQLLTEQQKRQLIMFLESL